MVIVVDASAVMCLAFKDEGLPYGMSMIDAVRQQGALAPPIFWYEVRNVLVVNERRQRITVVRSNLFLSLLEELPISIQPLPAEAGVLELSRQHGLSIYDASYLELPLREGLPLATLDQALITAAKAIQVQHWV
jgi:predicted nucleic acid-binding protein